MTVILFTTFFLVSEFIAKNGYYKYNNEWLENYTTWHYYTAAVANVNKICWVRTTAHSDNVRFIVGEVMKQMRPLLLVEPN